MKEGGIRAGNSLVFLLVIVVAAIAVATINQQKQIGLLRDSISSLESSISSLGQEAPEVMNAPLVPYWVVCEEADTYGKPDPERAAGTVFLVFNSNPANFNSLAYSMPANTVLGSIYNFKNNIPTVVGAYRVFNDQASVYSNLLPIEPNQGPREIINGGNLFSYYCNDKNSGRDGRPMEVKALNYEHAMNLAVSMKYVSIASFTTKDWKLKMYGHVFTGYAHEKVT